ncbi:STAS domain-containing protein [Sulfurimonas aquatica]|uniref:STAS domain-containing protein n=1 Tax=Sulfurimonas aquatica TaxID=2672570 RepID=A0A975B259_9BACT|nr:SulP family inorganic anion transporter [Sulfurimonas aquatica]QSZ42859.1 STAS domain-containing protein [Sulfurimonas aquatica]
MLKNKNLSGDLFGGMTAAIVALPLALAFGVQSGMGAIAGLYGAIALGFFASLFGGTHTQISGPTGPMTVVSSAIIAGEIAIYGSIEAAIGTIVATFVLAGLFMVLMGISRIGQYIRYMPYPVISGFMSGIGIIIILMQIFPVFGMKSPGSIIDIFSNLGTIENSLNINAMILAFATIAIIYTFPKVTKAVPSTLVALLSLSIISSMMALNVPIIGDIPKGLPDIHLDTLIGMDWHHPMVMIIPALTLASLGAIDSLLTSVVADNMTKTQHDSNKELIGQGIGNMVAGIIGGLPGAGATMRTVVNIHAGGRGRLSGVVHSLVLLIVLFGVGDYAKLIPLPVLAGILITVGIGIIDYKGIKHLFRIPRSDAVVMIIVVVITVFVDLLQAVAMGLVMASLLFMKQMGDISESKAVSSTLLDDFHHRDLEDDEKAIPDDIKNQVYIQHFDGPIFFGFTAHFKKMMKELPSVSIVIFRMHNVPSIDQSGMYAIEDAILELHKKNITVVLSEIQKQPKDMLKNIELIPELVAQENIFLTFREAVEGLNSCQLNYHENINTKQKKNIYWRY